MIQKKPQRLLPVGLYDILFDEAEQNHKKINLAIDFFLENNYRLIKTPLLEFADNFAHSEIENSLLVSDVISGKNLVLRSDITPQISRLLEQRLKDAKLPLKLCYVGDVLFKKSNELYADRQSTQVGIEIIGSNQEKSNHEIIAMILEILPKLVKKNLLIEFYIPKFAEILLEDLANEQDENLLNAIHKKDLSAIKNLAGENADLISEIALSNDGLEILSKKILAKTKSKLIIDELKRAEEISKFVRKEFPQIKLCYDLFGDDGNSYHQDIAFDIFVDDFSYPIARGGRYQINGLNAVGATIYMNYLRKI